MNDNTAIVLTSHPKGQKWWAPVLLALERFGGPLILAYDDRDLAAIPPAILQRFALAKATGYPAGELGHGRGELFCMKLGFEAAADLGVPYCLKLGFDEPPWRWRNLARMVEQLIVQDLDCMDDQTRAILGVTTKLVDAMNFAHVIARGAGSAESYWLSAGIQTVLVRRFHDRRYWEKELGLIHLPGEYSANAGKPNRWAWTVGEIWPREDSDNG